MPKALTIALPSAGARSLGRLSSPRNSEPNATGVEAVNGLMGEVMEDHILEHVVGAASADARTKSAEEFAEIVKAYLK